MNKKKAFTLTELIIIMGILSVLLVVWVTLYQKWIGNSRDTKRLADLEVIESALNMDAFSASKRLSPDDYIDITLNGKTIAYQWYFGEDLHKKLWINKTLKDPLDKTYYTYYTNSGKTEYQLLTFVENKKRLILQWNNAVNISNLKDRFPFIKGDDLWMLIDYDSYNPIQEVATGSFDIANTTNNSIFYINQYISFDGIWEVLVSAFATITKENKYIKGDSNLIWLFDFDNISGSWSNDYSSYGHNGMILGATIIDAKLGKWLEFDGINDMFKLNVDLNQWLWESGTITLWIKTTQVWNNTAWTAPGITWSESSWDGDDIFRWRIDGSGYINIMAGNDAGARSNQPINDGEWYHIWLSRDHISGETKVYVNGELNESNISETGTKLTPFWSFGVIINDGNPDDSDDKYFKWSMDQITIYKRVLLDKEVKLIYDYSLERDF